MVCAYIEFSAVDGLGRVRGGVVRLWRQLVLLRWPVHGGCGCVAIYEGGRGRILWDRGGEEGTLSPVESHWGEVFISGDVKGARIAV